MASNSSRDVDRHAPDRDINTGVFMAGGGVVNVGRDAIGKKVESWPHPGAGDRPAPASRQEAADVGVLTVLAQELSAVVEVLRRHPGYRSEQLPGGPQVHRAIIDAEGGDLRVVAMQTLESGSRSATVAYQRMREEFAPQVVLLVGIAGGIRPDLAVGDVVIADAVIYYDARRETGDGPRRRGQSQPLAPVLRHRVNEFFRRYGESIALSRGEEIRMYRGPIGSGDAVVTDAQADIIAFLRTFNEKTLAVETEAGGLGQAFYEQIDNAGGVLGWLTIRGISDLADRHKGHHRHRYAADRAALVMDCLLPLLKLSGTAR
jgi:adenosylhomocysteine nucleosidase